MHTVLNVYYFNDVITARALKEKALNLCKTSTVKLKQNSYDTGFTVMIEMPCNEIDFLQIYNKIGGLLGFVWK